MPTLLLMVLTNPLITSGIVPLNPMPGPSRESRTHEPTKYVGLGLEQVPRVIAGALDDCLLGLSRATEELRRDES